MTIRILSIDIGKINTAIGFAEFVPGGSIRVLSLELFSPKPSNSVSWGEACDRFATVLFERLTTFATPSDKLYTVVERQISKSRANCHLALIAQASVQMWSLTKGRSQDTFRYLWAPEKFVDPVPATVRTHTQWKRHGIFTVIKFIEDHAPLYQDIQDLIFSQHSDKPDDLCDCFLQLIATHHRLQHAPASFVPSLCTIIESEDEDDEPEDEPEPKPKPKKRKAQAKPRGKSQRPKKVMSGPVADLDAYR